MSEQTESILSKDAQEKVGPAGMSGAEVERQIRKSNYKKVGNATKGNGKWHGARSKGKAIKYTEALAGLICASIGHGLSIVDACRINDVDDQTFRVWQERIKSF